MRDHLQFHLNGRPVRVAGDDAFLTLSDFLRRRQRLMGTKVVCAEGDCGSCSLLIGRRDSAGAMRYATVTSCIAMVFQLDGCHVVTIEGLGSADALNPIQKAMVECHGAQCGFCTPGFVASLYQMTNDAVPMTRANTCRALVGNLCRCTGYDAILAAAERVDATAVERLETRYADAAIGAWDGEDVLIDSGARRVYVPATLGQALTHRSTNPDAAIVAGSTDVGVLVNKRVKSLANVLAINGLHELRDVHVDPDALVIGAAATLTDLERQTLEHIPPFGEFLSWFGSPPIKNAGTLGGNLATGSPIGDSLPALMVLNASITLSSVGGERSVLIGEFYTGYRKSVMLPDELITSVRIPKLGGDEALKLYKVSKRRDLDISSVSVAILLKHSGGTIHDARVAFGGVGPTVVRATAAEIALRVGGVRLEAFQAAADVVRTAVKPISDVRGSADYRRAVAGNLLLRCYHDLIGADEGSVLT